MKKHAILIFGIAAISISTHLSCNEDSGHNDFVNIEPQSLTFKSDGGQLTAIISSSASWKLYGDCDWCTTSSHNGENNDTILFTTIPNISTQQRSLTYTFICGNAEKTLTVTQEGTDDTELQIQPSAISFRPEGGQQSVTVQSKGPWSIGEYDEWISFSSTNGDNGDKVTVFAQENYNSGPRTDTVIFTSNSITTSLVVTQESGKIIQFNDPNFLKGILENNNIDINGDKQISISEAEAATELILAVYDKEGYLAQSFNITDLSEIKYFINLDYLDCSHNLLSELDLSHNIKLTKLYCASNQLSKLDVTKNVKLEMLFCRNSQLNHLNISNNTELKELYCDFNQLTQLDISNNTQLTFLDCGGNQLTQLDVSNNLLLIYLFCAYQQITELDVSNNDKLQYLHCDDNQLTQLDVTNNPELIILNCFSNQFTELDISNNTRLEGVVCDDNQLTQLDVSNNHELTTISCARNNLSHIDISKNTKLTKLLCFENRISYLDLSNNKELASLWCYSNNLTKLDVSNNPNLTAFYCFNNPLVELIISTEQTDSEWYDDILNEYPNIIVIK